MNAYLGIDVSKGYADFTLMDQNKKELEKVFQLDDTRKGHDTLKEVLERHLQATGIDIIYCAVESTGGFENNWYAGLMQLSATMPLKVARLNPGGVKNNIQADLNRNITDALSSRYIAEYLIAHPDKPMYDKQDDQYASFRSLHNHIRLLNKQSTQLINEMKFALYNCFPEMTCYCKQGVPQWVLETLKKYPSSPALAKARPEQLKKIPYITQDKVEALIKKAKDSVASRTNAVQEFLVKNMASEIALKQEEIARYKKFLSENCKGKQVELVDSIPGFAAYSAAAVMVDIVDIRRFPSPKELVSYFGLHPEMKQSGDKLAYRMSKKGRSSMRATLYMPAQAAVLHDAHLKAIYHRHRSHGKTHKQAIGVIMHKLLRIIWGVLTSEQPYKPEVDQENQNKKPTKPADAEAKEIKEKRRYQPIGVEAPVSNKQVKKRKAHIKSQVEQVEQVRDQRHAPDVNI